MVLIIGGAYQGKLEFAKNAFCLDDGDIYSCTGPEVDFSQKCIYRLEEFAYACVEQGVEPKVYFEEHRDQWEESILICRDIFCGVVPLEAKDRAWRQATGRLCQYLSKEAEGVSRIFCVVEQRLK